MSNGLSREFLARGDVHPRAWPGGRSELRAECLIEGSEPQIEATVRFAQTVTRHVVDADGNPVEELAVAGRRHSGGEELEEHEVRLAALPDRTAEIRTPGSRRAELREKGAPAGSLVWSWEPLHGTVEGWVEELGPGLRRVCVEVANRLEYDCEDGEGARRRALHATHLLLHSPDGAFVSLANPPAHLRKQAADCRNEGLWPIPVGEAGDRRTVLAAPIQLEDYSRIDTGAPLGVAA